MVDNGKATMMPWTMVEGKIKDVKVGSLLFDIAGGFDNNYVCAAVERFNSLPENVKETILSFNRLFKSKPEASTSRVPIEKINTDIIGMDKFPKIPITPPTILSKEERPQFKEQNGVKPLVFYPPQPKQKRICDMTTEKPITTSKLLGIYASVVKYIFEHIESDFTRKDMLKVMEVIFPNQSVTSYHNKATAYIEYLITENKAKCLNESTKEYRLIRYNGNVTPEEVEQQMQKEKEIQRGKVSDNKV